MTQALRSKDDSDAMLAVSAMVGALLLARFQSHPMRSDALRKAVRERVLALKRRSGIAACGSPATARDVARIVGAPKRQRLLCLACWQRVARQWRPWMGRVEPRITFKIRAQGSRHRRWALGQRADGVDYPRALTVGRVPACVCGAEVAGSNTSECRSWGWAVSHQVV